MRSIIIFVTLCLLVWLGSAAPMNAKRRLINRPSEDEIFNTYRGRRYATENGNIKGRQHHAHSANTKTLGTIEKNLRKGEYVCEGKVCRMKPGVVPKGCGSLCQHAV